MDRNQKLPEEQQEHRKHYCHICREGLNSQRALGEHMRSHEITDELISNPDEDTTTTTDREIYDSRNNHNPHQTSHICENRGEAFRSWKSFYEHNHCCSVASSGGEEDDPNGHSQSSSSSRSYYIVKRTDRDEKPNGSTHSPPHLLTEDEDVVNCLLMLSGATRVKPLLRIADREECSTSISKEADDDIPTTPSPQLKPQVPTLTPPTSRGNFECKDCKKVFPSHQALGGHRASHKKVKGCFAACLQVEAHGTDNALMEDENNNINHKNNRASSSKKNKVLSIVPIAEKSQQEVPNMKSKEHICSVCERQFPSGQALGGHKRCHWITSKSTAASVFNVEPISMVAPNLQIEFCSSGEYLMHPHTQPLLQINNSNHQPLDLNQPEPMDDLVEISHQLDMPLQLGDDVEKKTNMNKCTTTSNNNIEEEKTSNQNMDDEAESEEVKLAKLWDLKDMDEGVERSTWLQLGTGSMSDQQSSDNQS